MHYENFNLIYSQILCNLSASSSVVNKNSKHSILLNQLKVYSEVPSQGLTLHILAYLLPEEVYSQQFPWLRVILGHCFSLLPAVKVKTPISYIVGTPHLHQPQQMQSLTEEDMTSCRDSDAPEAGGAAELVQMRFKHDSSSSDAWPWPWVLKSLFQFSRFSELWVEQQTTNCGYEASGSNTSFFSENPYSFAKAALQRQSKAHWC